MNLIWVVGTPKIKGTSFLYYYYKTCFLINNLNSSHRTHMKYVNIPRHMRGNPQNGKNAKGT